MQDLRKAGKGFKQNAAESLSAGDKDKLRELGQLGDHSPEILQQTVWFYATMHFRWRGRDIIGHSMVTSGTVSVMMDKSTFNST